MSIHRMSRVFRAQMLLTCAILSFVGMDAVQASGLPWVSPNISQHANEGITVTVTGVTTGENNTAIIWFLCQADTEPPIGEETVAGSGGIWHKTYHLTIRRREEAGVTNILDLDPGQIVQLDVEDNPDDWERNKWKSFPLNVSGSLVVHRCLYNVSWLDTRTVFVWQSGHAITEPADHKSSNEICEPNRCTPHPRILHRFRLHVQFSEGGKYWATCRAGKYMDSLNTASERTFLEPEVSTNTVQLFSLWRRGDGREWVS